MRLRIVSLAALVATLVACGGTSGGHEDAAGSEDDLRAATASASHPCSLSREAILAAATPARQRAMTRGFQWLDERVPYSQSASREGYRTDCSGFVSMCWELDRSSTSNELYAGGEDAPLDAWGELAPADAVVKRGHVMLFLAFDDAEQNDVCVLEQASTKSDMQFRVHAVADLRSQGYKPVRAAKLATLATEPATATDAEDAPTTSTARVAPAPSSTAAPATPTSGDPGDNDDASAQLPPQGGSCSASSAPAGAAPAGIPLLGLALAASFLRRRRR